MTNLFYTRRRSGDVKPAGAFRRKADITMKDKFEFQKIWRACLRIAAKLGKAAMRVLAVGLCFAVRGQDN